MQVFVKVCNSKTFLFDIDYLQQVRELKDMIENKTKIPRKYQKLIYNGRLIEEDDNIKFRHGDTMFCNVFIQ